MASLNAPVVVLPQYVRSPVEPSRLRRGLVIAAQLLAATVYGLLAVTLPVASLIVLIFPVLLCVLIALWIMPDRRTFPLQAIERGFRPLFVLMIVWPEYIAVVLPGLPWLTPTRMVLIFITTVFLYSLATSAVLRRHLFAVGAQSRLIWTGFIMWEISLLVSLPFSHNIATTAKLVIDRQISYAESFFLGCLVFARRGTATWAIACMIILAIISSFDGFLELKMGHPPWALHIPSFLKVDDTFLANVLGSQARSADGLYRVRGPFPNSLIFAEFLAMCTPFILHYMLTARSIVLRIGMFLVWGLVIGAIFITHSRLGLVGTLVALMTYVPLWAFRAWRSNGTSILGPTLLFGAPLIALGLIAVIFSSHRLTTSILGGGAQESSNEGRATQRQMSVPKILANPLGYGLGQGGEVLGFRAPDGTLTVDDDYMVTTLDLGIIGVVGFYGMFAVGTWLATKTYFGASERESELAGPLASMFVVFLVIRSVLAEEHNHSLALTLFGMAMALRARDKGLGALAHD